MHQTFAVANGMKLIQHVDHKSSHYYVESVQGMQINSLHHQVVKETEFPALYSDQYGTVEAIEYPEYPAITVQWHPEMLSDSKYVLKSIQKLLA